MVVALGVTLEGDKVFLGFVQTDTENAVVIRSFLRGLKDRGLDLSAGALVVIDGAKGLRSGVLAAFKDQVLIQRCQWHKRENVISHLPRAEQKNWRQRLQRAYQRPTYKEAAQALKTLKHELGEVSQSAVASLNEGFEETLTLHRLGVFPLVGRSLKTTNVLESVNAMAEQRCGRVDHWKDLEPEAPMVRDRVTRDRAPAPEVARLPAPPAPQGRDTEGARDHPSREQFTCRRLTRGSLQFQLTLGLTLTAI